ncbi:MAG: hypothetical protein KF799_13460 [Bdellovibrionales bacterium]|nr:hypothetical protein [Bdellovibrionales bacterium]
MRTIILFLVCMISIGGAAEAPSVLRTYSDYSLPVDFRIAYLAMDTDISGALGAQLVTFDTNNQLTSRLAQKWTIGASGEYVDFELKPNLKWSDGQPLVANDVKASFADTKRYFLKDFSIVFASYSRIEVINPRVVRFYLRKGVSPLALLSQMVDSRHGIVKLINGKATMAITAGPYSLASADSKEVVLKANLHYTNYSKEMFQEIRIRRPPPGKLISGGALREDPWPDFIQVPTIVTKSDVAALPPGSQIWSSNHDRTISLSIIDRKRLLPIRTLLGFIKSNADLSLIGAGAHNAPLATQLPAKGLVLYSRKDPAIVNVDRAAFLKVWDKKTVSIAYDESRIPQEVLEGLKNSVCSVLPVKCVLERISLRDLKRLRRDGGYDLVISSMGADPTDIDGAIFQYFERDQPFIPSDNSAQGNFVARIQKLRQSEIGLIEGYQKLLSDAVELNYVLPIFRSSTTLMGRPYMDFSRSAIGNFDFEDMRRRP